VRETNKKKQNGKGGTRWRSWLPVAKRSKARVCGHSLAGTTDSNPAGGIDVCVLYSKGQKAKVGTIRTKKYGYSSSCLPPIK
jgi:hypothetical protein